MTTDIDFSFLDIGQGQSSLIFDRASSSAIVVDCAKGAADKLTTLLGAHADLRLLVVTHLDMDHCRDLMRVVRDFRPDVVRLNMDTTWKQQDDYGQLRALLRGLMDWSHEETSGRWLAATAETPDSTPSIPSVSWSILAPEQADIFVAHDVVDRNPASVIMRVQAHSTTFLFTGDTNDSVLARLLAADSTALRADVLVFPHHGGHWQSRVPSRLTTPQLYAAVDPELSIFSVGARNRYGHPFQGHVEAAAEHGGRVMCTEATPLCHPPIAALPQLDATCAGDIRVQVSASGHTVTPTRAAHGLRVEGWDEGRCRHRTDEANGEGKTARMPPS